MFVVRVPQEFITPRALGLGSPLKQILTNFQQGLYARGLTILPSDKNAAWDYDGNNNADPYDRRGWRSDRWDPCHHHQGRNAPRPPLLTSLTISHIKLVDSDIRVLQDSFENLNTLSVAFNHITDAGLIILLRMAPNVMTFDLEANAMVFDSEAADML